MGQFVPSYVSIAMLLVCRVMAVPISGTYDDNEKEEVPFLELPPHKGLNEEDRMNNLNKNMQIMMGHPFLITDILRLNDLSPTDIELERGSFNSERNYIEYNTETRNILNRFLQVAKRQESKRSFIDCDLTRITFDMLMRYFKTGNLCSANTLKFRFGVGK